MEGRFSNPFVGEQVGVRITPKSGGESPFSGVISEGKVTSTSSPKRRRSVQKRVVSVPIKDVDGSRLKGEGAPPSDSWAWRKYGQKPIKGSPYPRGYYRCSSSKGCPARKQVERSRVDPTRLVITYACEHNHPWPASRNSNSTASHSNTTATTSATRPAVVSPANGSSSPPSTTTENDISPKFPPEEPVVFSDRPAMEPDDSKFGDLGEESMITSDDFSWFSDVPSTSPAVLESTTYPGSSSGRADVAMIFQMREEDESLFADLGELPECSLVFRRGIFEQDEESRRCSPVCGSTG
ncbi:PREDICTED: probable WRKY transcription factor 65 isoform X2 [Nelumbo nucifera]|uniref:WRKY domain-containing protein n=2 Tax=Nelumbo nucifera TaxID=4432 RepID=A0A822YZ47_NELNU|nr:PREDICTED: probable WRKY transcription factor 65 isoform X2 [Nelumbo nucifera]DAD37790.1 TPA_asm: hypothetical protein HUJ06_008431 [Nelumbo nucifera]